MHFTEYIKKNPYEKLLNSSEELFKYTINLHNNVNRITNKLKFTYEQADKMYEKSPSFDEYLRLVCIPAYVFFQKDKLHLFPNTINDIKIIWTL